MSESRSGSYAIAQSDTATTGAGNVTAKATSETLAAANPNRAVLTVSNPSAKEVWLGLGTTAVKEKGIWLKKEGGSIVIDWWLGSVTVVTTEGEGTVTFTEV
jgi:hypothetical protein